MTEKALFMCVCALVKPPVDGEATDQLYGEMKPAVDGANYIIKHMHNKNNYNEVLSFTTDSDVLYETLARSSQL